MQKLGDMLSVGVSGLCLLHCLFLPALVLFIPATLIPVITQEVAHLVLFALIFPLSFASIGLGVLRHRHFKVISVLFLGITCLLAALFIGHTLHREEMEMYITVVGSTMVILAHIWNIHLSSKCMPARA